MNLEDLYKKWEALGDIPTFDEDTEDFEADAIEEEFLHFPIGTPREDIWHWFEAQTPKFIVGKVHSGIRKSEEL